MKFFTRLFKKRPDPREAVEPLWQAVVAEARKPHWYNKGGVEDSVTGRFDMVTLVASLVMLRMESSPDLTSASARLTECFVADMDGQLREFGVNDVVVGKRVGRLVGVLGGRLDALRICLNAEIEATTDLIERNVVMTNDPNPRHVASELVALSHRIASLTDAQLLEGAMGDDN